MSSSTDKTAKKAAIYSILSGYWQLADKLTDGFLAGYLRPVEDITPEAVALACQRIASGQAGLNTSYPPTPADIASRAALLDAGKKPQPRMLNGIVEMDFGSGRVDLRGLTDDEQDIIIRNNGKTPDGRNAAFLTLDEKLAALKPDALPAPERIPVPRLRKV